MRILQSLAVAAAAAAVSGAPAFAAAMAETGGSVRAASLALATFGTAVVFVSALVALADPEDYPHEV